MKRIIMYCVILAVLCVLPVERQDVADLEPIQAVWLSREEDTVMLETDTQDQGSGKTVSEALADMKQKSLGIIYLDTAQYLLVSENAREYIPDIAPYLKGSVRICLWDGAGEVADAARYMQSHKTGCKLKNWHLKTPLFSLPKFSEKSENNA